MPRLPTEADLGNAAAPRVGAHVSGNNISGDETAVHRATAKLGQTVENVGDALYKIDKELTKARQASQLSDAVGRATGELGELELRFQKDQDFKTAPTRYAGAADLIFKKYEQSIDDPTVREAFGIRFRNVSTAKRLNVVKFAAQQEGDYNVAMLDRNATIYATSAANAANSAERDVVIDQFRIDLSNMRMRNWITDVEAGNRERAFLGKIDMAIVTRDMVTNPGEVAVKLSLDAKYAQNIAPEQREKLIDQAYRRSGEELRQREAVAERERKRIGDDLLKTAHERQTAGTLDRPFIERLRPFVEPNEYKSLLAGLSGADRKDDPAAFSHIEGLVETNPADARRQAFVYHQNGRISNQTLQSVNTRTRGIERQEGPRSPYERERSHITQVLKPSEFVTDPAPGARYALAIREFDDYANEGNRSPAELRAKADDVVKRFSMVDMADLARRTGLGGRATPQEQITANLAEAERLMADRKAKKISEADFKKKMNVLERSTAAAEKAMANGGK